MFGKVRNAIALGMVVKMKDGDGNVVGDDLDAMIAKAQSQEGMIEGEDGMTD